MQMMLETNVHVVQGVVYCAFGINSDACLNRSSQFRENVFEVNRLPFPHKLVDVVFTAGNGQNERFNLRVHNKVCDVEVQQEHSKLNLGEILVSWVQEKVFSVFLYVLELFICCQCCGRLLLARNGTFFSRRIAGVPSLKMTPSGL